MAGGRTWQIGEEWPKWKLRITEHLPSLPRFCQGKTKVLITTNLCVRGICMESVTLVVNYDIPMDTQNRVDCDTYVHR